MSYVPPTEKFQPQSFYVGLTMAQHGAERELEYERWARSFGVRLKRKYRSR